MKNSEKIPGILLFVLLAGFGTLNAQKDMRGMRPQINGNQMRGMEHRRDSMVVREMRQRPDSLHMRGIGPRQQMNRDLRSRGMYGMNPSYMPGMRNMRPGNSYYNWRGPGYRGNNYAIRPGMPMYPMGPGNRSGMRPGRGMGWSIDALPNITEKQKEEISQLQKKQQEEMKKIRDEMTEKMNTMRESHRKAIINQLTDEQKKVFEARAGKTTAPPVQVPDKKK